MGSLARGAPCLQLKNAEHPFMAWRLIHTIAAWQSNDGKNSLARRQKKSPATMLKTKNDDVRTGSGSDVTLSHIPSVPSPA